MHERPFVMRYGIAIAAWAAALLLRVALNPWLGDNYIFSFFYPAVAVAVWFGGVGPAVMTIVLSVLTVAWWFLPVRQQWSVADPIHYVGGAVFLLGASIVTLLGEVARQNLRRARDSENRKDAALRALAQSERLYRAAGELIPFGIWVADARGRATYLSQSFLDMLGTTFDQAEAEWAQRMEPRQCEAMVNAWIQTVEGGQDSFEYEFHVRDKEGQVRTVLSRGVRLRDETSGTVRSWVGVHFDITSRKQMEQSLRSSERQHRIVIETAHEGIWLIDTQGRTIIANQRMADMVGCARVEDLEQRAAMDFCFDEDRATAEQCIRRNLQGFSEQFDFRFRRTDGTELLVLASTSPMRDTDGTVIGALGMFSDITERKRFERELARLAAIVESSDDAIISNTADGIVTSFNSGAERIFGYRADEVIGKPLSVLLPSDRGDDFPAIMERIRRGERSDHYETVRRRKDGTLIDVSVTISPLRDETGRLVGASKVARDITLWKRAERALRDSEERFRTLADNIAQLAWMADEKGWIFWYNRRWFEYTGTTLEQMQGWGWQAVHHPDHVQRVVQKIRRCFETGEVWEDTFPLRGRDGNYRWFLSRATPIRDESGTVLRWFGTNTDITERRQAEEALREADRRKDDFLAMLGHELRNPLAPIRNAVQVLQSESAHEREWARDVIDRQVRHLTRLVDDLLDVSRITRGVITLRRQRIALAAVVHQAVEVSRPFAAQRQQALEVVMPQEELVVDGDEARLAQILQNLLHNATKFSPDGGQVRLIVERDGPEAVIRVCDDGCGIAPDMLERVFEPFSQASQPLDRAQGGLGIGLTLVKVLAELHGGRVAARSDGPEQGSEFIVHLPLAAARPGDVAPDVPLAAPLDVEPAPFAPMGNASGGSNGAGSGGPGLRVLVVDDNYDSARSMSLLLKLWGHRSEVAQTGQQALDQATAFRPDVILLDIGLPGMSGYDVARELRRRPESRDTLLVAMTGYGQTEDRQRSAACGFDHHLVKPVDPVAVEQLLASLRSRRAALNPSAPTPAV